MTDLLAEELRRLMRHPLSKGDWEVLPLLVMGLSNQEIAHHLSLSVGAVASRIYALNQQLEVSSRAEAAYLAQVLGLVKVLPSEAEVRLFEFRERQRKEKE